MRLLLLLLLATAAMGADVDPDDDTVPAPKPAAWTPKVVPAPEPTASTVAPAAPPSSPAPSNAPTKPAPVADPMRGGYPESAHAFFKARADLEREMKKAAASLPKGASVVTDQATRDKLAALNNTQADLQLVALNSWFGVASHIPSPLQDGPTHQFWLECCQARDAIKAHTWPCWGNDRSAHYLQDLGSMTAKTYGPDWLDDMIDGAHKGSHRTN